MRRRYLDKMKVQDMEANPAQMEGGYEKLVSGKKKNWALKNTWLLQPLQLSFVLCPISNPLSTSLLSGYPSFWYPYTVYHDGTLCMDIIQDAWSPCHNVATILTSIQSLLTDPNPASPANPEAAQLYQHDIQAYNKFVTLLTMRVRRCARKSIECP
ncbi:hypothetical protein Cgig2_007252 [Carnegiea gigantea]|uniref:UBC core domain-containing protein n=1 Tax=Carnegiea gigantea TaxID=171969 RepID=A0A9Q1QRS5_9CARY|nr:hypothetical protein Cgig2_007252 [Carnegiea gigantea]